MGGFDFNTVITGSGISKDPPSSLPLGDELAVMAWARLLDAAARIAPTVGNTLAEVEPRLLDLRLEQLLELCVGAGMDVDSVESVYAFMADAEPNHNHQLMASLPPHVHLTLNIDTLLEGAGFAPDAVAHLHGRVDRPRSVMTTVSQYLEGLEPALEEQLVRATRGRSVLVVGYSGRDFDVFPTIVRAVPRRLRWLVRPGSRLSPEVEAGLTQLRAAGCEVDASEGTLTDVVSGPTAMLVDAGHKAAGVAVSGIEWVCCTIRGLISTLPDRQLCS